MNNNFCLETAEQAAPVLVKADEQLTKAFLAQSRSNNLCLKEEVQPVEHPSAEEEPSTKRKQPARDQKPAKADWPSGEKSLSWPTITLWSPVSPITTLSRESALAKANQAIAYSQAANCCSPSHPSRSRVKLPPTSRHDSDGQFLCVCHLWQAVATKTGDQYWRCCQESGKTKERQLSARPAMDIVTEPLVPSDEDNML